LPKTRAATFTGDLGLDPWSPEETASIPILLTAGLIGGIVVNAIWGAFLGFVAIGIKKVVPQGIVVELCS
jgi:hypothetical protein